MTNTSTYNQSISQSVKCTKLLFDFPHAVLRDLFCMQCNIRADNKCSSSWKDPGSETKSTAVSLVWLSVPFTKTQNLHREPICFSSPGMNQSHYSMGPREAMLRPQKRAKKSPTLIWAGSCLVICVVTRIRDLSSVARRLRGSKSRGMIQMCGYVICESLRIIRVSFSVMSGHPANELEHFYFCEMDIRCYSKGYCQSWIHWGQQQQQKNARKLFSELLGTEPFKVWLIEQLS